MIQREQPRTRQRALLAEWGIDEYYVTADGIDNHGIWVVGEYQPEGFAAIGGELRHGTRPLTQYGYRTQDEQAAMMKAKGEDWTEYVSGLADTPTNRGSTNE